MRIREYTSNDFQALRRMHSAQGFGYPFPDLESPIFVSKLVLEEECECGAGEGVEDGRERICHNSSEGEGGREVGGREASSRELTGRDSPPGSSVHPQSRLHVCGAKSSRVTMAILQRLTAETYLLHDPAAGTPRQRWQNFLALHDAALHDAVARGLDDAQAFLPPQIARSFGRRLARLGWTRDPWPCFSRRV
ncbi:MAG: hypothetical protein LAO19_15335 [Acidobacteriia bacterium]|nr:hypothetical protein [Terriglobia bacterium]